MSQKPNNITGFDPRKFAQAAGPRADDPWARNEAWRYTGPFTRRNRFRGALPGLGWGAGAFALYLVYEQVFLKDRYGGHHGDDHGKGGGH